MADRPSNMVTPTAIQVVASAVDRHPVSNILLCHRKPPKDARLGNYRSGSHRKKLLPKMGEGEF